jgi:hypothetical protein
MNGIDVETLRAWLEDRSPVTVLDIRGEEDRQQWSIPGSLRINAYDDLKARRARSLAWNTVEVPRHQQYGGSPGSENRERVAFLSHHLWWCGCGGRRFSSPRRYTWGALQAAVRSSGT